MPKISYDEYLKKVRDLDTSDEEILALSEVVRGEGAFDPRLRPDPNKVEMTSEEQELESAMGIGNGLSRWRRNARFWRRLWLGENLPVLVSEGDSWFQFPLLIKEVIDQLENDYLIWSVGAAGDTARNMIYRKPEYIKALRQQKDRVRGFLFSAAGNDIIGEDPETGSPVLFNILKPFNGNENDVEGHINQTVFNEKLDFLKGAYSTVIRKVRAEPGIETIPILIHGYDYVFPYPWGLNDTRNPIYADRDGWLGKPLNDRNIKAPALRRNILMELINQLHDMLRTLAGDSTQTGVWLVDCRGAMPDVGDWNDEIHGTSDGFSKVATRFRSVMAQAGL